MNENASAEDLEATETTSAEGSQGEGAKDPVDHAANEARLKAEKEKAAKELDSTKEIETRQKAVNEGASETKPEDQQEPVSEPESSKAVTSSPAPKPRPVSKEDIIDSLSRKGVKSCDILKVRKGSKILCAATWVIEE